MGAVGLTLFQPINEKWNWNLSAVFSSLDASRNTDRYLGTDSVAVIPFDEDHISQQKFSVNTFLKYRIKSNSRLRFGIVNTLLSDEKVLFSKITNQKISGGKVEGVLLQPYFDWTYDLSDVSFNLGFRSVFFGYNNTFSFEPRVGFKWNFLEKSTLGLVYSLQSQRQLPQVYLMGESDSENGTLELTKAHHLSLIYENFKSDHVRWKAEVYYQSLFDVPVAKGLDNSFSALNVFDGTLNLPLKSKGTGENYGIELTAQQYFYNNIFWLGNVSVYESTYKGSDGIKRDTRFNGNYIVNGTFGKEFPYSKKGKDYILGVNLHLNYSGGLRETPIDEVASKAAGTTILDEATAFSLKQKDVFKTNLRVYWKRDKKRFNSTLSLDIQNVTNNKNVSFQYYDALLDEVVQQYQLGLIPILSYRIEF